jgi:hypothetical protein
MHLMFDAATLIEVCVLEGALDNDKFPVTNNN